jgi:hypothetical protein
MPSLPLNRQTPAPAYRGRQTKTGNSSGFRFEGALFKSHPEFNGMVQATVIAPGRMLVTAEPLRTPQSDPVMESFLAFLSNDLATHPETARPLDEARARHIEALTKGIETNPEEDLGDVSLL